MSKRLEFVNMFYNKINEDERLSRNRQGQMEYITTMHCIHRFVKQNGKILEVGAGTGRYSIALAKEGFEQLFKEKDMEHITTVATDSVLELAEGRSDFAMADADFEAFARYHLATCEKRELLGCSSHLLYIARKK